MTIGICNIRDMNDVWLLHYPLSMMRDEVHNGYVFKLAGHPEQNQVFLRIGDTLFYRVLEGKKNEQPAS